MEKDIVHVKLLGKIELRNKHGVVDRQTLHSDRLIHLLSYILIYRNEVLTMKRLCEALWKSGESENPIGALKNLMYRLRNGLKELGNKEFIVTGNGSYQWNEEIPVEADFEEFEKSCQMALDVKLTPTERIEHAKVAVDLYGGALPSKLATRQWALPVDTYFRSSYLDVVKMLAQYYSEAGEEDKAEQISNRGLRLAGFDEVLHYNVIKALINQDKHALALTHYNKAIKQIYDQPGIHKSRKLEGLYEKLLSVKNAESESLEEVFEDIDENSDDQGVFMCEYGVFKEIFRLEKRRLERVDVPEYLLLLTIKSTNENERMILTHKVIARLETIVKTSLRRGDAAARYSENQYVLLLINCLDDAAQMVAERIVKKCNHKLRNQNMEVTYDLKRITGGNDMNVEEILEAP